MNSTTDNNSPDSESRTQHGGAMSMDSTKFVILVGLFSVVGMLVLLIIAAICYILNARREQKKALMSESETSSRSNPESASSSKHEYKSKRRSRRKEYAWEPVPIRPKRLKDSDRTTFQTQSEYRSETISVQREPRRIPSNIAAEKMNKAKTKSRPKSNKHCGNSDRSASGELRLPRALKGNHDEELRIMEEELETSTETSMRKPQRTANTRTTELTQSRDRTKDTVSVDKGEEKPKKTSGEGEVKKKSLSKKRLKRVKSAETAESGDRKGKRSKNRTRTMTMETADSAEASQRKAASPTKVTSEKEKSSYKESIEASHHNDIQTTSNPAERVAAAKAKGGRASDRQPNESIDLA